MNTEIKNNVQSAFAALFDGPEPVYETPWEKWNMSYAEWHRMYLKACDEHVKFYRELDESLKMEKARKLLTDDDYQLMEQLGIDYVEYIHQFTTYLMEV